MPKFRISCLTVDGVRLKRLKILRQSKPNAHERAVSSQHEGIARSPRVHIFLDRGRHQVNRKECVANQ